MFIEKLEEKLEDLNILKNSKEFKEFLDYIWSYETQINEVLNNYSDNFYLRNKTFVFEYVEDEPCIYSFNKEYKNIEEVKEGIETYWLLLEQLNLMASLEMKRFIPLENGGEKNE